MHHTGYTLLHTGMILLTALIFSCNSDRDTYEDEMDEAKLLWENQINDLKMVIGS